MLPLLVLLIAIVALFFSEMLLLFFLLFMSEQLFVVFSSIVLLYFPDLSLLQRRFVSDELFDLQFIAPVPLLVLPIMDDDEGFCFNTERF